MISYFCSRDAILYLVIDTKYFADDILYLANDILYVYCIADDILYL